jgi:hypothetical protein
MPQRLVVNIETGAQTYVELDPDEAADLEATRADAAQARAAEEAALAARDTARTELAERAAQSPDLALIAKAMGLPLDTPDGGG